MLRFIDSPLALFIRKQKKLSRADIARNSLISGPYICAGSVLRLEKGYSARLTTIEALANQLGLDPALLMGPAQNDVDGAGSDFQWAQLPDGMTLEQDVLRQAIHQDMAGNHTAAAHQMRALLKRVPARRDTWKTRVLALAKLASFETNMGRNDAALRTLARIDSEPHGRGCHDSPLLRRVSYLKGIALRRKGCFDEARALFQALLSSPKDELPATHQLGVAALEEGIAANNPALLEDAEVLFDSCLDMLGRETGHAGYRAALALRRMGQLRAHQGRNEEAFYCYLEAFGIFASHGATRYVNAVRAELSRFLFPNAQP